MALGHPDRHHRGATDLAKTLVTAGVEANRSDPARSGRAPRRTQCGWPQRRRASVGVATVGRGDMPVALNGLGTVTSLATVTIRSQISGYLVSVAFREGQIVQKGDLLAQIDPRCIKPR